MASNGPTKALLCLHGTGSSANIFKLQLAKFRLALKNDFEFIFLDAPYAAPAGPGVLPMFAGAGPCHGWFSGQGGQGQQETMESRLDTINKSVKTAIDKWQRQQKHSDMRIVGIVAFSEGALVASMLLWQQQLGRLPWLPVLHFATLICCFFPDEAGAHMKKVKEEESLINVPTLHIHGRQDFCLARARKLVGEHYTPAYAHVMEFDGGHQVPNRPEDCREAIRHMLRLAKTC